MGLTANSHQLHQSYAFAQLDSAHSWLSPLACRDPYVYHTLCTVGHSWELMLDRQACNTKQKLQLSVSRKREAWT